MTAAALKRALLAFWALWHTVVLTTNACDALKELGVLPAWWQLVSGNYRAIGETTARYGLSAGVNAFLFGGVILWEALAAVLFWRVVLESRGRDAAAAPSLYSTFGVSLLLWAAFAVVDEVMIAYAVEASHLRLFIAQLVTLLAIVLLPERNDKTGGRSSGG